MLKILCRALGHRCRVVQEFTPTIRRVKCVRCGGDWDQDDILRMMIAWGPEFERFYRSIGFEILEPLPAWRSFPVEPLTWGELFRAMRWPAVLSLVLTSISNAGLNDLRVELLVVSAIGWGVGCLLGRRSIARAYERKCNSLEA